MGDATSGKKHSKKASWYKLIPQITSDGSYASATYEDMQMQYYCGDMNQKDCVDLGPACDKNGKARSRPGAGAAAEKVPCAATVVDNEGGHHKNIKPMKIGDVYVYQVYQ